MLEALRAAHRRGARLMSVCSGAFVLAAAGLLDGKRATTHWRHAAKLAAKYPNVRVEPSVLYVQDDRVYTAAGSAAGIDLGLHLVRQDYGSAIANQVARRMVVPPHREGGQAQFVATAMPGAAATVRWRRSWSGRAGGSISRSTRRPWRARAGCRCARWPGASRRRPAPRRTSG